MCVHFIFGKEQIKMNADKSQVWQLKEESETCQADKKNKRIQKTNLDPRKHEILTRNRFILNRATDTIIPEYTEEQTSSWHTSTMCKKSSEKGPLCSVMKKCKERHKLPDLFHKSTNRNFSRILRCPELFAQKHGARKTKPAYMPALEKTRIFLLQGKNKSYIFLRKGGLKSSRDYSEKIFHTWIWRYLWWRLTELLFIYITNLSGIREN